MRIKRRVFEIVEVARLEDAASRIFDLSLITLIILNVVAVVLESVASIHALSPQLFQDFEVVSVLIFTVEYLLRVWTCTEHPVYTRPIVGRVRYALTPLLLIDLVAILPFYLPFFGIDLLVFRAVRLFRLFRLLKLARYSAALQTLGRALVLKREELLVSLSVLLLLLLLASCVIYFAENTAQPDVFSSIPAAMWWGVATLTTVGYGDTYPVTPIGKVLGAIIAILGIGMFALPTGILGTAFVEELERRKKAPVRCPHCGRTIESAPKEEGTV